MNPHISDEPPEPLPVVSGRDHRITDASPNEGALKHAMAEVKALRKSEYDLRLNLDSIQRVLHNVREVIYSVDADTREFSYISPAFVKMFGYDSEDIFRMGGRRAFLRDIIQEDHFLIQDKGLDNLLSQSTGPDLDTTTSIWRCKDGGLKIIEDHWYPVYENGRLVSTDGILHDITDRMRSENDLRRLYAENRQILTAIPSILIGLDDQERIYLWNRSAEEVFDIPARHILTKPLLNSGIQWDWTPVLEGILECRAHLKSVHLDVIHYTNTHGKEGSLGLSLNPFQQEADGGFGLLIFGSEITERLFLEHQLRQAQKLEAIGQLAAGIAHEINTPIQYVGDNTRFLQGAFEDLNHLLKEYEVFLANAKQGQIDDGHLANVLAIQAQIDLNDLRKQVPEAIQQTLEGVDRVTRIVRSMRDFAHPGTTEKTPSDLNKAIESTVSVTRNEWKYLADLAIDLDPTLPLVPCLLAEFNQVILNLIINAVHAIEEVLGPNPVQKGRITIRTCQRGNWAEISITDTGNGIPSDIRTRIFDPFFTTKQVGKGTGQGLTMAHATVVERHQGTLTFETEVGKGTTFFIRLPIRKSSIESS